MYLGQGFERVGKPSCSALRSPSQQRHEPPQKLGTKQPSGWHIPDADVSGVKVPNEIRCTEMIRAVLRVAGSSHTGFGEFCRRSMQPARQQDSSGSGTDLWPCPPPRWHWTAAQKLSPKRRRRKRWLETKARCLQYVVVSLNWLSLGCPKTPPVSARLGSPLSDGQLNMLERLEDLIHYFLRAPNVGFDELGRAAEKLANLCTVSFDLGSFGDVDHSDISSFLQSVSSSIDPYGSDSRQTKTDPVGGVCSSDAKDAPVPNETAPVRAAEPLTNRVPLATTVIKEVLAERIKWKLGPSFDPLPFLSDPVVHSAFQQPDVLRLPERDWPRMAKAQVHCKRAELLKLAQKWDELGACRLGDVRQHTS